MHARKTAQTGGARQAVERRAAHRRRLEGRHELGQRIAQLHAAAELLEILAADHVDRGRAGNDRPRLAASPGDDDLGLGRSEEHTSELQSLMLIPYAVL